MQVYVYNSGAGYQLYPVPTDLTDFTVIEVADEAELATVDFINYQSTWIKVPKAPNSYSEWNGTSWVTSTDKLVAYNTDEFNLKVNVAETQLSTLKSKITVVESINESTITNQLQARVTALNSALTSWTNYYTQLLAVDLTVENPSYPQEPAL